MTVIVWDGKTLAADRRACSGGVAFTTTKIYKIGDKLFGFAGNAAGGREMVEWIKNGAVPADFPKMQQDKDDYSGCLIIEPGPRILKYERTPYPIEFLDGYHAIGSGRDFALAAMHLGKTAAESVEVASALTFECGNGVDTLTL